MDGHKIHLKLHLFDRNKFLLVSRGFNWIRENLRGVNYFRRSTQTRLRATDFHAGDVWKTVLCLKHYRRDLDVFTIATPWSGLTVVTGLDPGTEVLSGSYQEAVAPAERRAERLGQVRRRLLTSARRG